LRAPLPEVAFGNSGAEGEWWVCADEHCRRTLSDIFADIFERPIGANVIVRRVCEP